MAKCILTAEGLQKINQELEHIKAVKLPQAEKRFDAAKKFGFTKDDFEYTDSKAERDFYKKRIVCLEDMIATAKII